MFSEQKRYGNNPSVIRRTGKLTFAAPLKWKARRIFTCSWSDFFIEEADEWRADAWDIIRQTPKHTYLILTKRPHNISERLPADWGKGYQNVWLGVTAEDQLMADKRLPILAGIPCAKRFISAEPLLGPIHFDRLYPLTNFTEWIIVGGESGSDRVMRPEWVYPILDECHYWGIPFFFKQWGGHGRDKGGDILNGRQYQELPKR